MNFDKIKKLFASSCVIFTLLIFVFFLMGLLLYDGETAFSGAMNLPTLAVFYVCSLLLAMLNLLFVTKLPSAVKYSLHLIGCIALLVAAVLMIGLPAKGSQLLIISLIFAIVYGVIAALTAAIRSYLHREKNNIEHYESMFKKDKK